MGNELTKWRVTGPDGFETVVAADTPLCLELTDIYALAEAWGHTKMSSIQGKADCLRQAGYRAEPIEEPKMVTVRAEDLREALRVLERPGMGGLNTYVRLRAALDGAK